MKKNLFLVAAWILILSLAAFLLPPLDSRAGPGPLLARTFIVATVVLFAYTMVMMFGYFNRAWRRVGLVSNRVQYASWLCFETVLFLVVLAWILKVVVPVVAHRLAFLI